jgi:hypothetical protein
MSMIVRHPFRNFFSSPFDVDWNEAYKQAMIPEDGAVIVQREWVEKKYRVKHESDGTVKYIPFTEEVVSESD